MLAWGHVRHFEVLRTLILPTDVHRDRVGDVCVSTDTTSLHRRHRMHVGFRRVSEGREQLRLFVVICNPLRSLKHADWRLIFGAFETIISHLVIVVEVVRGDE